MGRADAPSGRSNSGLAWNGEPMSTVAMDFGTSNSAMAFRTPDGSIQFVRLSGDDSVVIPSYLKVLDGQIVDVGNTAKTALAADPKHVLWGLKRLPGLSYNDGKEPTQILRFQYDIKDHGGNLRIEVDGHILAPIDLVSKFLRRIREQACESPD